MTESIIEAGLRHHQSRFLQIRADFLAICDSDETMAKLLRILESWTDHRRAVWYQEYLKSLACQQAPPAQEKFLWIAMSHAQFIAETLSTVASEHTIKKALCRLQEKGYIERRLTPDEPYGRYQYRLRLDAIQSALDQLIADMPPAQSASTTPLPDAPQKARQLPTAESDTGDISVREVGKHEEEDRNVAGVGSKNAGEREAILHPSQKKEKILCTIETQMVKQDERASFSALSPQDSIAAVEKAGYYTSLPTVSAPICSISQEHIQAMTSEVASILGMPTCPALRRIVEDFVAVEGLSLLGEADAAHEYILDQRRNRTQQQMSPAFFRRWLKREQEAMQERAVARRNLSSSFHDEQISSVSPSSSSSHRIGVYPSLMHLDDFYRNDMERSVTRIRQQKELFVSLS